MSHVLRVGPRTILLDQPRFVIGSGPHSDCRVVSEGVQPSHAALLREPQGISVLPLEGRTFVNGLEISKPTPVSHAMTIQVGRVKLQLVDTDAIERERLVTQKLEAHDQVAVLADALDAIDTAIADGRWGEAGQRIKIAGDNIGADSATRRFLDPISHRATVIADASGDASWIDWILQLCARHQHVPSSAVVDALLELSRSTGWRCEETFGQFAKSVESSEPTAQIRLRRLLAG